MTGYICACANRYSMANGIGIRNYMARNNLRAMRKGELAFFYHSNCKEPGIMGTMEIVQEHSPDCKWIPSLGISLRRPILVEYPTHY